MIITSLQEMRWFEKTWGCLITNPRRKINLFQRPWVCVSVTQVTGDVLFSFIEIHLDTLTIWGWAVNTTLTQLSWEFDAMNVSPVYTFSRHADTFAFIWGCACKKNVIQTAFSCFFLLVSSNSRGKYQILNAAIHRLVAKLVYYAENCAEVRLIQNSAAMLFWNILRNISKIQK